MTSQVYQWSLKRWRRNQEKSSFYNILMNAASDAGLRIANNIESTMIVGFIHGV